METNTEVTVIPQPDPEMIEKKKAGWAKIGELVYTTDLQLQAMAQQAINGLVYPKEVKDIPAAEDQLKALSAKETEVKELRLAVTNPVKEAFERLMIPEKSFAEPKAKFTKAIVDLKKINETANKKVEDRNAEIVRLKEAIIKRCAELDAKFKLFINDLLDKYFIYALEQNIAIHEINANVERWSKEGVAKVMEKKIEAFALSPVNITLEEARAILEQNYNFQLIDYANTFEFELKNKFKDYEVAFHNKKDALTANAQAKAEAAKAIADQKLTTEITASIEASATPLNPNVSVATKDLKKVYEVDMPETFESAMLLLAAFMANKDKALKKTTTKKWFAFNASSAATALEKMKNEENEFAPVGIKFKEVAKL